MTFTTPVHIAPSPWHIAYTDYILSLGSCFADNIAAKLAEYYFQITANPFGTLYNPLSIAQALSLRDVPELVEWGGLYHSMYHHGSFSSPDHLQTEQNIRQSIRLLQHAFAEATVVIITFGTAWVYEHNGQVVANCHKMPADRFTRRRLTVEEIVATWQPILAAHPGKHFIFTVSPIRHIKDGLHENQLSKATLLSAIDKLLEKQNTIVSSTPSLRESPQTTCSGGGLRGQGDSGCYFPSYEILLDELRDYRFYADDMLHPSPVAVQYIWKRFVSTYMSASTQQEMQPLHQLYLDRHHTLLHPDTPASCAFLSRLEQNISALRPRYPWI